MRQIFSRTKEFDTKLVGNSILNRLGLHKTRIRLAAACNLWRYKRNVGPETPEISALRQLGYLKLSNFLTDLDFENVRRAVLKRTSEIESETPIPVNDREGFQVPATHHWGFDRFDGGTLNRFINIDHGTPSAITQFTNHTLPNDLTIAITGKSFQSIKAWIYQTIHGDDTRTPDIQKELHRDTFFSSMKFWYFIEPVTLEDGPFAYVPYSNQVTKKRLDWEQAKAMMIVNDRTLDQSGSFRISKEELCSLDLPAPKTFTVPANTLIIADTLGFHKRSNAKLGAKRLAIYGNLRPHPFDLT